MKFKSLAMVMCVAVIIGGMMVSSVPAAEVVRSEKVVMEEKFVKMADNFIILFDTSKSMDIAYKKGATMTNYEIAKKILREKMARLPDLGFNSGMYMFTPYQELYPMGSYSRGQMEQAVDSLPAQPGGPTFLPRALREIKPVVNGLSGKTIVYIITDGTYSAFEGMKEPEDYTAEIAAGNDVCFLIISYAKTLRAAKRCEDMAKANACSRVIPFQMFADNPDYITGALYTVKTTERIVEIVGGLDTAHVLFEFDKSDIRPQFQGELDSLGMFLQENSGAYVLLEGYADSTGPEEYNLLLSERRANGVANYLRDNFNVGRDRLVVNFYGEANPVASNASREGRALNRRVEMSIGGM